MIWYFPGPRKAWLNGIGSHLQLLFLSQKVNPLHALSAISVIWDWILSSFPSSFSLSIPSASRVELITSMFPRSRLQPSRAFFRASERNSFVGIFSPILESPGIVSIPFVCADVACSVTFSWFFFCSMAMSWV